MYPKKTNKRDPGPWVLWILVVLAGAGLLYWRSSRSTVEPSKAFIPRVYPAPAHYSGDPAQDTARLLSALNRRMEESDLLKLLDREVETRQVQVRGKAAPSYRETFRLPSRSTPSRIAGELTRAARSAGAQPLKFEMQEDERLQETQYVCTFGFSSEWAAVEIVLAKTRRPRVCLIIDDAGYHRGKVLGSLYSLKVPLTVAVIPGLEFAASVAREATAKGVEVLCHLPMEGSEPVKPGAYPFFLRRGLSPRRTETYIRKALDSVPECRGLNNHMGSVATRDADLMLQVCSVLKSRGLFFVDSKTALDSMAAKTAASIHMPYAERNVFLDNEGNAPYIRGQFRKLIRRAQRNGTAVGIGHLHETTLEALAAAIPEASEQGIVFVYASEVVK